MFPHRRFSLQVGQFSDTGRQRAHNEDWLGLFQPVDEGRLEAKGSLFVVADGMGGHQSGELASCIAVDQAIRAYSQDPSLDVGAGLRRAIEAANRALTARPPSPRRVNPDLTPVQERVLYKALAKTPSERFSTSGDLIQALLDSARTPRAMSLRTPIRGAMPAASRKQRRLSLGLIFVAVVLLAAALFLAGRTMGGGPAAGAPTATVAASSLPASTTALPPIATVGPPRSMVSPTATKWPTATLAPTRTRTPRPTATATPVSSPLPAESVTPGP